MEEVKQILLGIKEEVTRAVNNNERNNSVTVIGFDMPFMDMVSFMVKWAIATIPAAIILGMVGFAVVAFFAALGGK
jgi:predicted cobalt transporter CbtA